MDPKVLVPSLSYDKHKGQYGKVGIVGGCVEYTGAPYYAGISALKTGADLCHVFCAPDAAIPIKCYSPELIVHPFLSPFLVTNVTSVLGRLDALVVGPGLGRDPDILDAAKTIIGAAKARQLPLVLDGDALFLVSTDLSLVHGYEQAILTPNIMEYTRLCVSLGLLDTLDLTQAATLPPQLVAAKLGHVTVLQKGHVDVVSDGVATTEQASQGCPRRCGGQGDVRAGRQHWNIPRMACRATLVRLIAIHDRDSRSTPRKPPATVAAPVSALCLAALGGSLLTRESARLAFATHGRATTTPDLIASIPTAFGTLFDS
ncbi:Aste57867_11401 [Aphanomyces stellatus]|uniref:ATP-dependent (S)-NAD(P)H-hydrate dehydratase n=1 Tax=Aphanomyces stellatus TaxID=120398 RepID=A0A485KTH4_9STRA|nr:hypothetical protein As57867_011359 [Aphanomyces stellatus]VFT88262.1 Aste57867_11401 [Aphanomyces stellatus]